VRVDVDRPESLAPDQLARWREIQRSHPELASAFLCPEFALAVSAARADVFVASIESDERLVGFFPFQRRGSDEGLPPGFGISNSQGPIADPTAAWDAVELVRRCGLRNWHFDHLVPSVPFEPHCERLRNACFIDISAGLDAYVVSRRAAGSRLVVELERQARKLEREVGPLEFTPHTADIVMLEKLMEWKSAQYRRTRVVDRFRIRWVVETVERIHATQANDFAGMLSVLSSNGVPVALHMGIRSHAALESWFPAYDPEFARYSPGLILMMRMIESAAASGLSTIELGRSGAVYKERLMSGERTQAVGTVLARPNRSRRRISDRLLHAIPSDRVGRVAVRLEERRQWRSLEPRRPLT
jgi:CelD/BcsL family acetyltransferase involved in cellulose biosynthesis